MFSNGATLFQYTSSVIETAKSRKIKCTVQQPGHGIVLVETISRCGLFEIAGLIIASLDVNFKKILRRVEMVMVTADEGISVLFTTRESSITFCY